MNRIHAARGAVALAIAGACAIGNAAALPDLASWYPDAAAWMAATDSAERYAFDQFYPGSTATGCLAGPPGPTLALAGGTLTVKGHNASGTQTCALLDGSTPAVSDALIGQSLVSTFEFNPPVGAFFTYFGSLAAGRVVNIKLYAGGLEVSSLVTAASADSILATGAGFISSVPIDRIMFTSNEPGPVLVGAFVGLRAGVSSLGTVGIPGYPGPAGADVLYDFGVVFGTRGGTTYVVDTWNASINGRTTGTIGGSPFALAGLDAISRRFAVAGDLVLAPGDRVFIPGRWFDSRVDEASFGLTLLVAGDVVVDPSALLDASAEGANPGAGGGAGGYPVTAPGEGGFGGPPVGTPGIGGLAGTGGVPTDNGAPGGHGADGATGGAGLPALYVSLSSASGAIGRNSPGSGGSGVDEMLLLGGLPGLGGEAPFPLSCNTSPGQLGCGGAGGREGVAPGGNGGVGSRGRNGANGSPGLPGADGIPGGSGANTGFGMEIAGGGGGGAGTAGTGGGGGGAGAGGGGGGGGGGGAGSTLIAFDFGGAGGGGGPGGLGGSGGQGGRGATGGSGGHGGGAFEILAKGRLIFDGTARARGSDGTLPAAFQGSNGFSGAAGSAGLPGDNGDPEGGVGGNGGNGGVGGAGAKGGAGGQSGPGGGGGGGSVKLVGTVVEGHGVIDARGGTHGDPGRPPGDPGRFILGRNNAEPSQIGTIATPLTNGPGSRAISPYLGPEGSVPLIPGLAGGPEAFGITGLGLPDLPPILANAPPGTIAALIRMDVGPAPVDEDFTGFDMVLMVNVSPTPISAPAFGVGRPGHLVPLRIQGIALDPVYGGAGPRTLAQLAPGDVWATLVPESAAHYNLSANGVTSSIPMTSGSGAVYLADFNSTCPGAQADTDFDGLGDPCDGCPLDFDPGQEDLDGDGAGDACDNCLSVENSNQRDLDADSEGDLCDLNDGMIYMDLTGPSTLAWQQEAGFDHWNLYRSDLDLLRTTGAYTQALGSSPLAARSCGLTQSGHVDLDPIPAGKVAIYMVTGMNGLLETALGTDSAGALRLNGNPCP